MKTTFDRISGMTAAQRDALAEKFDNASRLAGAEPVAVVGVGCRFPGGVAGPESYWKFLANGVDAIAEVPTDRWDAEAFYDPDPLAPGRMPSKWGGFLSDVAGFDADFFGITPREAEAMDPQQRVLLEVAWEAIEHAGIAPDQLAGSRAAVMMGVYYGEYQSASATNPDAIDAYSATGNAHSVTVGRVAYLLGLHGPAVAVDTACSSSLVSVHLACQSLRMRESDLALAGGVSLILRPETQLALGKWGMLSPRGRCHAFDAGADGFVRGEGAGVVVLKRLTDAVRDGDRVLGVVRGSAVNQDGRSNGLTAPNAPAQRDVMTRALRSADVTADSVNFVETHGTGTALGDPIEFDALAAVYGRGDTPCGLGAVKTNMGHLEAAAGIAGFIKALLSVQKAQIPPNLHFTQWNPAIDPSNTRLFVPTGGAPWPEQDGPRRAGVSSFGLGGTNAHVVLEQGPDPVGMPTAETQPAVTKFTVSGRTPQRVAAMAAALADWMENDGAAVPLSDIAYTVNHGRNRYSTLATVCARDRAEAVSGLRALAAGRPALGVAPPAGRNRAAGTVFVYSGQGAQWPGMGRGLLADEPAFAAAVAELEPSFHNRVGFSLREVLESGEPVVGIDRIQPVLVGMQLALTALWRAYGVEPDAVIGHSMGEITAAVVAGALSVDDGLGVIATRSRLMSRLSGQGAMALLEMDVETAEKLIIEHPDVTVAVHASPRQTVIAGPPDQVDAMVAVVEAQGRLARRVDVDVASHHPTIDPILPELRSALGDLAPTTAKIPLISTTAGRNGAPMFGADYWLANLRNPVRFSEAVATAAAEHGAFVEISPHPLLTHAISETIGAAEDEGRVYVGGTIVRDTPEAMAFHTNLACLRPGADSVAGGLTDIPPTPWLHTRYWKSGESVAGGVAGGHPLLGLHVELPLGSAHVWQADVGTEILPWLSEHRVHGQPVMPAAGFAEIAVAAGCEALVASPESVEVRRLEVEQVLPLDNQTRLTTQLVHDSDDNVRVEIHSRSGHGGWTRHAVAALGRTQPIDRDHDRREDTISAGAPLPPVELYAALRRTGAHHGQAFAALTRIERDPGAWAEADIALPDEATAHREFRIHPVMLDAALQTMAAAMPNEALTESGDTTYLPTSLDGIRIFGAIGRRARCRAELLSFDGSGARGRLILTDELGTRTAQVADVYLRRVQRRTVPLPLSQKIFDTRWAQTPAPSPGDEAAGSWLLLADDAQTFALADEFASRFSSSARRIITADLSDESAVLEAFADTASVPDLPPAGVVVVVGNRTFDDGDADAALGVGGDLIWKASAAVRAIAGGWHGRPPRLWLVSHHGLAVDGEAGNPAIGGLRGLVRVLAYEYPDLRTTLLDFDGTEDLASVLTTELASPGRDDVVAWRGGQRYVQRLSRAALPDRGSGPAVRNDGAYIVTGGLGGVGMTVARRLIDAGAARVVLNGRNAPSDEARSGLTELEGRAEVVVVLGDIAHPGIAEKLVECAELTGRSLRGVIHSAAVLEDQLVAGLSKDSLARVWAPKVAGAMRLHRATAEHKLDWWVGFSSVASLLGSPGQAAYACANAWLDAFVDWRRAAGLPAIAINWGQWSDVGLARSLNLSVLDPITPAEGVEALDAVLASAPTKIGVARLRLDRASAAFPEIHRLGYFQDLVAELEALNEDDDWAGPEALSTLNSADARAVATARLRSRIAAIMGSPDDGAVAVDQPLTDLGLDSLMAVRMRNTVRGDFGVEPPVALLLQGASLTDLASELIRQLGFAESETRDRHSAVRDKAQKRAAARQRAVSRRKVDQRL